MTQDAILLGQSVRDNAAQLRTVLPQDSTVLKALTAYETDQLQPGGCRGCRNRRMLRWLAAEVQRSTPEQQFAVQETIQNRQRLQMPA